MDLSFSNQRLVIEYIATYQTQELVFKLYKTNKFVNSFSYQINKDNSKLSNQYKQFIINNKVKPFANADIVVSSYDTAVTNMRLKKAFIPAPGVAKNFLIDNFGTNYEAEYILNKQKVSLNGGYELNCFYGVRKQRFFEMQSILNELGIKKFRISFIGEYINRYVKANRKLNNSYLIYEQDLYVFFACVTNNQIVKSFIIPKDKSFDESSNNINNLSNLIISLSKNENIDDLDFETVNVIGPSRITKTLKNLDLNIISQPQINSDELLAKAINGPYIDFNDKPVAKKAGFDWAKFLGIKKGFTLAESIVSIAIFSIIAALTATFILISTNTNLNTKRQTLAQSYLNSVNEKFNADPTEASIRNLTKYEGEDLLNIKHGYYLNALMEVNQSSISSKDMSYQVYFEYQIFKNDGTAPEIAQPYNKYVFTIVSIHTIQGLISCAETTSFTVVK